jgi:hypothetical protein
MLHACSATDHDGITGGTEHERSPDCKIRRVSYALLPSLSRGELPKNGLSDNPISKVRRQ